MSLAAFNPIGFIPTANAAAAREFYENTLGCAFESDDQFALVFRVGPNRIMLRIAHTPGFTPESHTIFGWVVDNIHAVVTDLTARGVEFQRFGFLSQDAQGIWQAPGGAAIAWFNDPDGNTLSVSQHPG